MFPNGASSLKSLLRDAKASPACRVGYFTLRLTSDPFSLTPRARHPHVPRHKGYPWVGGCVPPRGSQMTPPARRGQPAAAPGRAPGAGHASC